MSGKYTMNCTGEFLCGTQTLDPGGDLVEIPAPIDQLGTDRIRGTDFFEVVQVMLSSAEAFAVSTDGTNYANFPEGSLIVLAVERMILAGEAGDTVTIPRVYVQGAAGEVAIVVQGDVHRNSSIPAGG